jgi:hypothetical protein
MQLILVYDCQSPGVERIITVIIAPIERVVDNDTGISIIA